MNKDSARIRSEVMLAYADGAEIQFVNINHEWEDTDCPIFVPDVNYRVKPDPRIYYATLDSLDIPYGIYSTRKVAESYKGCTDRIVELVEKKD